MCVCLQGISKEKIDDFSPSLSNISSKPDRTRRSFKVLSPSFSKVHGMEPWLHWEVSSFLASVDEEAEMAFVWMSCSEADGAIVLKLPESSNTGGTVTGSDAE